MVQNYLSIPSDNNHPRYKQFASNPWFTIVYTPQPKNGEPRFRPLTAEPRKTYDWEADREKFAAIVRDDQLLIWVQAAYWTRAKQRIRHYLYNLHRKLTEPAENYTITGAPHGQQILQSR